MDRQALVPKTELKERTKFHGEIQKEQITEFHRLSLPNTQAASTSSSSVISIYSSLSNCSGPNRQASHFQLAIEGCKILVELRGIARNEYHD